MSVAQCWKTEMLSLKGDVMGNEDRDKWNLDRMPNALFDLTATGCKMCCIEASCGGYSYGLLFYKGREFLAILVTVSFSDSLLYLLIVFKCFCATRVCAVFCSARICAACNCTWYAMPGRYNDCNELQIWRVIIADAICKNGFVWGFQHL